MIKWPKFTKNQIEVYLLVYVVHQNREFKIEQYFALNPPRQLGSFSYFMFILFLLLGNDIEKFPDVGAVSGYYLIHAAQHGMSRQLLDELQKVTYIFSHLVFICSLYQ